MSLKSRKSVIPYECEQCDYTTRLKELLTNHKLTHLPDKPFKCEECSFATHLKKILNAHKLTHITEKEFKCDQCDFASHFKAKLATHKLKHSSQKLYNCDQCSYETHLKHCLFIHKQIHLSDKPHKCDQCPYASRWKKGLDRHKLTHIKKLKRKSSQSKVEYKLTTPNEDSNENLRLNSLSSEEEYILPVPKNQIKKEVEEATEESDELGYILPDSQMNDVADEIPITGPVKEEPLS